VHSRALRNKGKARKMDSHIHSDSGGRTGATYVLTAAVMLSHG
jgi:hypothetical protein